MEIKTIILPVETKNKKRTKNVQEKKLLEKKKRVITQQRKWVDTIKEDDLTLYGQTILFEDDSPKQRLLYREIQHKIDGYRRQDISKNLYNETLFVDFSFVIELLKKYYYCFYCNKQVKLLYDISRDPEQWTLERISNEEGHNRENVKICCLSCNISRRTMYHEKFRFTKQTRFIKEDSQCD